MDSLGSFHFLEIIINSFLVSSCSIFLSIFFGIFLILNPKFIENLEYDIEDCYIRPYVFLQIPYTICYCIKCSKTNFCCRRILGVFSPIMFVFSLIIILLFNIASIFIFLGTLFSGNWEMLYIKLPNFYLHLDLGMIYNKNIIFLIK